VTKKYNQQAMLKEKKQDCLRPVSRAAQIGPILLKILKVAAKVLL
jgi:hypothetical protein